MVYFIMIAMSPAKTMHPILKPSLSRVMGVFALLTALSVGHASLPPVDSWDDWIWAKDTHPLCGGYYQEAPLPFPHHSETQLSAEPTTVTADQGQFTPNGNSILTGHVHLIQGNTQVSAEKAIIHRDPSKQSPIDTITANDHVKITQPGLRVQGTNAFINRDTNTQTIDNAAYRLYERRARGTAETMTITNQDKMALRTATYTTCRPDKNTWNLRSRRVTLNKKTGRGRARHSWLYLYNFPIFYWSYVDFPIDDRRQTGFLFPSYGSTNHSGLELSTPFYWNLAPNYDATLTPRLLSKRGLEMQGDFRYLSLQSRGEFEGSFLPNDRAYRHFRQESQLYHPLIKAPNDPRLTALNKNDNRAAFKAKYNTLFNQNWGSSLQYHAVHDDNHFMDFGSSIGLSSTTQLLQQGDIFFQSTHWNMQTRLQQYQTLHPFEGPVTSDVYRRLPQIAFQGSYLDLPFDFSFTTRADITRFEHKRHPISGNAYTTGDRFQIRPGLAWPVLNPGWFITPSVQLDFLAYSLNLGPKDRTSIQPNIHRAIPIFDIDSGLFFERTATLLQTDYTHTLEPRLYYLYVPYHDQNGFPIFDTGYPGFDYNQLFWDNRFTGLDRLGDANQVTLSVTSRLITDKTGQERLSVTLGQIRYFQKNKVTSCNPKKNPLCLQQEFPNGQHDYSSFVGLAKYLIQEGLTARANTEWNPYQKQADKHALYIQYHPDRQSVINVGYQFLRNNPAKLDPITHRPERLDQTDVSFAWPLTEKWRTLGRWHYDLHHRRSNDTAFGVEQQGCCTAVRLYVSRYLEPFDNTQPNAVRRYNKGIFLQFIFKGFAGVGNNQMNSAIHRAIPDYQWQEQQD
jgi:LPS-assembly protein